MKPIGPLMREHRLIERMVALLCRELPTMTQQRLVDADFLFMVIDFMETYADRVHYRKEEEILFKRLAEKPLSQEHRRIMDELIREHLVTRDIVRRLSQARFSLSSGDRDALEDIHSSIRELASFYPVHIEEEDKHFFYPSMDYLTEQEQDTMLQEIGEFDSKLIHEKYQGMVEGLEKRGA